MFWTEYDIGYCKVWFLFSLSYFGIWFVQMFGFLSFSFSFCKERDSAFGCKVAFLE